MFQINSVNMESYCFLIYDITQKLLVDFMEQLERDGLKLLFKRILLKLFFSAAREFSVPGYS